MTEEWKDIKGYEGLYQISNFGRVKSLYFKKEKILKPHSTKGYLTVRLYRNKIGKDFYIHCLVMDTFNPNKDKSIELNQIFGSLREAERQLDIPATNISKACRGIYKTAGGYYWEYCDQKKRRGEI